ncbi:hypothetical protein [Modestobacter altitudinis]|nr:hypothetical protein [Modestobacter altitudinis]
MDIRDRKKLGRFSHHRIDPPYRLWVWVWDLDEARRVLHLVDA